MLPGRFRTGMPSILEEFFGDDFVNQMMEDRGKSVPAVNVVENNDSYELEIAAPGMTKDDISVDLDNNVLKISGSKKHEDKDEDEDKNYMRREFSYTEFERSFTLPEECDENKIEANYEDGVLKVNIPKKEVTTSKGKKKIDIQ